MTSVWLLSFMLLVNGLSAPPDHSSSGTLVAGKME